MSCLVSDKALTMLIWTLIPLTMLLYTYSAASICESKSYRPLHWRVPFQSLDPFRLRVHMAFQKFFESSKRWIDWNDHVPHQALPFKRSEFALLCKHTCQRNLWGVATGYRILRFRNKCNVKYVQGGWVSSEWNMWKKPEETFECPRTLAYSAKFVKWHWISRCTNVFLPPCSVWQPDFGRQPPVDREFTRFAMVHVWMQPNATTLLTSTSGIWHMRHFGNMVTRLAPAWHFW